MNSNTNLIDKVNLVDKSSEYGSQSSMLNHLISLSKEMLSRIKKIEDRIIQHEFAEWNTAKNVDIKRELTQNEIFLKNIGFPFIDMDAFSGFNKSLDKLDFRSSVVSHLNMSLKNILSKKKIHHNI